MVNFALSAANYGRNKSHKGLTIGVSAGAMNLCKTVANFSEEKSDLSDPIWFDGMGLFGGVIPHFDGKTAKCQFDCEDIDIVGDLFSQCRISAIFSAFPTACSSPSTIAKLSSMVIYIRFPALPS